MLDTFRRVKSECVNYLLSFDLPPLDDMAEFLAHAEELPPQEWRERYAQLVDYLPQEWSETPKTRQIGDVMGDCLEATT